MAKVYNYSVDKFLILHILPELPEVETHVRDMQKLVGFRIVKVDSNTQKAFRPSFRSSRKLLEKKIIAIRRRAKHIIFDLSGGVTLVAHFRMTGHFLIRKIADPMEKCVRHRFEIKKGRQIVDLRFDDIRKFGTLTVCDSASHEKECRLDQLGPEPLEPSFTLAAFRQLITQKKGKLKALLLNQQFIAGIGNIYADEICFSVGLRPDTLVERLQPEHVKKIHSAIRAELAKGVKNRGTTIGEFLDADGKPGGNQDSLRAYKRHGKPCLTCGTKMEKMVIVQRTSSYCPQCQIFLK